MCNSIPMMQPGTSRKCLTPLRRAAPHGRVLRQDFLDVTRFVIKWPSTQIGPQYLGMGCEWNIHRIYPVFLEK